MSTHSENHFPKLNHFKELMRNKVNNSQTPTQSTSSSSTTTTTPMPNNDKENTDTTTKMSVEPTTSKKRALEAPEEPAKKQRVSAADGETMRRLDALRNFVRHSNAWMQDGTSFVLDSKSYAFQKFVGDKIKADDAANPRAFRRWLMQHQFTPVASLPKKRWQMRHPHFIPGTDETAPLDPAHFAEVLLPDGGRRLSDVSNTSEPVAAVVPRPAVAVEAKVDEAVEATREQKQERKVHKRREKGGSKNKQNQSRTMLKNLTERLSQMQAFLANNDDAGDVGGYWKEDGKSFILNTNSDAYQRFLSDTLNMQRRSFGNWLREKKFEVVRSPKGATEYRHPHFTRGHIGEPELFDDKVQAAPVTKAAESDVDSVDQAADANAEIVNASDRPKPSNAVDSAEKAQPQRAPAQDIDMSHVTSFRDGLSALIAKCADAEEKLQTECRELKYELGQECVRAMDLGQGDGTIETPVLKDLRARIKAVDAEEDRVVKLREALANQLAALA